MDPYNRRKAAGGRTITVRLNVEDGALLDRAQELSGHSAEQLMRSGLAKMAERLERVAAALQEDAR